MTDTDISSSDTKKRPRSENEEEEDILLNLSQWIGSAQPQPGFCHEAVQWKATTRELTVAQDIAKDTKLFVIPASCIVTAQRWRSGTPDKEVSLPPQQQLHHRLDDVLIAWYLATQPPALEAYLTSLPMVDIANALPRRWPADLLQRALQGSPVFQHVEAQKRGVAQDYQILQTIMMRVVNPDEKLPSLEAFDQALAVVSSRAFAGKTEGSACLIPLLDLCNHQRGAQTKNLRYAWDNHGNMVVHAARTIARDNDSLCITYGAQSNGQLLVNYGFCIPDNVEPDGSSNNVYEFKPTPSSSTAITLRMGPKSYTYGPLVQVVEALGSPGADRQGAGNDGDDDDDDDGPEDGGPDDMEAFLNECEDEGDDEESGCGDECVYTQPLVDDGEEDNGADNDGAVKEQKRFDCLALENFYKQLASLLQTYTVVKPPPLGDDTTTRLQYAKLLVGSEQEILRFYQFMVAELLAKLDTDRGKTRTAPIVLSDTQKEQIQSLVDAFFQIRYTSL
eukprot:scaffold1992_cov187-Amphora_coffeaeformis.AAC.3